MGAALAMRLVRRFLADHRDVLQTDRDRREALVRILDVFVRAKWPSAFEIASRLEDAFR
ncbi:hypothetical protein [Paludisphaera soli]|uniref:hypothetical protein n=1 Tax=Paludisphaera soli TaxID=2712865 RepID=UPI0013ED9FCC|nr:hypothetical protein [Paludisphaera soli]